MNENYEIIYDGTSLFEIPKRLLHDETAKSYILRHNFKIKRTILPQHNAYMHYVFMLDISGSMAGRGLRNSIEFLNNFIATLDLNDSWELLIFNDNSHYLRLPNNSAIFKKNSAQDLEFFKNQLQQIKASGGTSFKKAFSILEKNQIINTRNTTLIFITDGEDKNFNFQDDFLLPLQKTYGNNLPPVIPIAIGDIDLVNLKKISERTNTLLIQTSYGQLTDSNYQDLKKFRTSRSMNVSINGQDLGQCYVDQQLKQIVTLDTLPERLMFSIGNSNHICQIKYLDSYDEKLDLLSSYIKQSLANLSLRLNNIQSVDNVNIGGENLQEEVTVRQHALDNLKENIKKENHVNRSNQSKLLAKLIIDNVFCNILSTPDYSSYINQIKHDLYNFLDKLDSLSDKMSLLEITSEVNDYLHRLLGKKYLNLKVTQNINNNIYILENIKPEYIDKNIEFFNSQYNDFYPDIKNKYQNLIKIRLNPELEKIIDIINYLYALVISVLNFNKPNISAEQNKIFSEYKIRIEEKLNKLIVVKNYEPESKLQEEATGTLNHFFKNNHSQNQPKEFVIQDVSSDKSINESMIDLISLYVNVKEQYALDKTYKDIKTLLARARNELPFKECDALFELVPKKGRSLSLPHIFAERSEIDLIPEKYINIQTRKSKLAPILFVSEPKSLKKLILKGADLIICCSKNMPVYLYLIDSKQVQPEFLVELLPLTEKIKILNHAKNNINNLSQDPNLIARIKNLIQLLTSNIHSLLEVNTDFDNFEILHQYAAKENFYCALQHFTKNIKFVKCSIDVSDNEIEFYGKTLTVDQILEFYRIANNIRPKDLKSLFELLERETYLMHIQLRSCILLPLAKMLVKNKSQIYTDDQLLKDIANEHQILKIVGEEIIYGFFEPDHLRATETSSADTAFKEYCSSILDRFEDQIVNNLIIDTRDYYIWDKNNYGNVVIKLDLPYIPKVEESLHGFLKCVSLMSEHDQKESIANLNKIMNNIKEYNILLNDFNKYKQSLIIAPDEMKAKEEICKMFCNNDSISNKDFLHNIQLCALNSSKLKYGTDQNADPHWLLVTKIMFNELWMNCFTENERIKCTSNKDFCIFMKIITNNGSDLEDKYYKVYQTPQNNLGAPPSFYCTNIAQNSLKLFVDNQDEDFLNLKKINPFKGVSYSNKDQETYLTEKFVNNLKSKAKDFICLLKMFITQNCNKNRNLEMNTY